MTQAWQSRKGEDVDPDIRRFIELTSAEYARHPPLAEVSISRAREVAETVRAPWAAGGPRMHRTSEQRVATAHGPVRVRVYNPSAKSDKPALIYVHGGGWMLFSIDTHDRLMREYAARADVVVVGVDYDRAPEARFPVALEQVVAVVRWTASNAVDLDVDAERLAVGGDSAGGNMSFAASLLLRDAGEGDLIKALLLNYAVLDDASSEEYHSRFGGEGYMLASGEMAVFWDNYISDPAQRDDPLASPMRADVKGMPPVFMTIPECDLLTGQSLEMAARLKEAGTPVSARIYPGATHSFLEAVAIAPIADRALEDASVWLRETLA